MVATVSGSFPVDAEAGSAYSLSPVCADGGMCNANIL